MANNKTGFSYYNVDTDRYQDIKIKRLKKEHGSSGIAVYDYILCETYRVRGCYLEWDENVLFDIAEYMNETEEFIAGVLESCMKIELFDFGMFKKHMVITSKSIQVRYVQMCQWSKRKIRHVPEIYDLIDRLEVDIVAPKPSDTKSEQKTKPDDGSIIEEFELFRKRYPGTKRGLTTEFENFKKKHKDYKEAAPLLLPALENLIRWREARTAAGMFVPEFANISTWINQRRWEVELEEIVINGTNRKSSESELRKHEISAEAARISGANA